MIFFEIRISVILVEFNKYVILIFIILIIRYVDIYVWCKVWKKGYIKVYVLIWLIGKVVIIFYIDLIGCM